MGFLDVLLDLLRKVSLEVVSVPSQQLWERLIQTPAFVLALKFRPPFLYFQAFPAFFGGLRMHRAALDGLNMRQFAED